MTIACTTAFATCAKRAGSVVSASRLEASALVACAPDEGVVSDRRAWSRRSLGRPASAQEGAVRAPIGVETPSAPYPRGATGDALVVLELEVAEDGTVVKALVREGTEPFAEIARRTTLGWRFEPATRNGIPVRARVLARVLFQELEPQPEPVAVEQTREGAPTGEALPPGAPLLAPAAPDAVPPPLEVTVVGEQREELGSIHIPRNETRQIPEPSAIRFASSRSCPASRPS